MLKVNLPDGKALEYARRVRPIDIAAEIGPRLAKATLAAEVDGQIVGANAFLPEEGQVSLRLITSRDPEALNVMRHSCAHVMARAVMRLYKDIQLAFGPTVENGFYYDFQTERRLSEEDFPKIEAEMAKIVKEDEPFERVEMDRAEALQFCKDLGQGLKVEHIETGLADHGQVSFYRQGEFIDLCRGPHVPSAGSIGAFKLLNVAGAYWKGDSERQQLQRLYGTAWFSKQDMEAYLTKVEEAKRRDHRLLGKQLELFTIDPMVGSGLILWLPKGAIIRRQLENFLYARLLEIGYQPVYTPHIGRIELYETSGHFPYYADSQFPPLYSHPLGGVVQELLQLWAKGEIDDDGLAARLEHYMHSEVPARIRPHVPDYEKLPSSKAKITAIESWLEKQERYLLKPMNCPHHIKIYQSKPRSYRELPLRLAEFGTVYRFEQSGELNGMTRVRGFTQDDAHIFCTEEQVAGEFRGCIEMTQNVLKTLGLTDYRVRLGFPRPGERQVRGVGRELATGRSGPGGSLPRDGLAESIHRTGGSRILWPEGGLRCGRLHRPRMAARDRTVGLQSAEPAAVRLGICRRRQPSPPAGYDSPRPVRVIRAICGHVDRALCRGIPLMAGPRAGPSDGREPKSRGLRPAGRGPAAAGRFPRFRRLSSGEGRFQDPRRPVGADSVHVRSRRA